MDSMRYLKNYNLKKNIEKANIKIFMIIKTNKIINSNVLINNPYHNTIFKETFMLIKHPIQNLNLKKEVLIMVYRSKKAISLISI